MSALDDFVDYKVSLAEEISLVEEPDSVIALVSSYGTIPFTMITAGIRAAFRELDEGTRTKLELANKVLSIDGVGSLVLFNSYFAQCVCRCVIQYAVWSNQDVLVRITLTTPVSRFQIPSVHPETRYLLSRFAYCHRQGDTLLLESPMRGMVMRLIDWRATALLSLLSVPRTLSELAEVFPAIKPGEIQGILQMLIAMEALTECSHQLQVQEDENTTLVQWEFHDLLFHTRSRIGRHNNPIGATFPYVGKIPAPVLNKSRPSEEVIPLFQPQLCDAEDRMSLFQAVETRHSIRAYGSKPLTVEQLGEFLFRVARIKTITDFEITAPDGSVIETLQLSGRPYPGGGAIYELEVYLTVDRCQNLASGLYHYDPLHHRLSLLRKRDRKVEALLQYAMQSAAIDEPPQVLITLAARFQRISWKYKTIGYATTLKNVGVLYQTMYLVATAMKLAPCALGSGNSDLFADAAGTDFYTETSVGEFMLGSLPDTFNQSSWASSLQHQRNLYVRSETD